MDKAYIVSQLKELADRSKLDISEEMIGRIVGIAQFKVYSKGDILARIGDDASKAGLVMSGVVRSYYIDNNGNDITQFFSSQGNSCMDSGMFGLSEMTAMWEALDESTIMIFDVKQVKSLIMSDEGMMKLWIDILESGMRYKIYRENGFLVENATERYLSFIKHYPDLSKTVPQKHIATYLGIAPESLSRIRSSMKEDQYE